MKQIVLQIFGFFFFLNCQAQQPIKLKNENIDRLIVSLKDSFSISGISVSIAQNDSIFYENSFGLRNKENQKDIEKESLWPIGSVSKQFCVAALLHLVKEKSIELDTPISSYYTDLPLSWKKVTIRQLLSHTSGIKDYISEQLYGKEWDEMLVKLTNDTLNFSPGSGWSYSNTGFWLASRIIEKTTGISYFNYLNSRFFKPLGIKSVCSINRWNEISNKVDGYDYLNNPVDTSSFNFESFKGHGDGDLIMSTGDLMKWEIALTQGKNVDKLLLNEMFTPTKLNSGEFAKIDLSETDHFFYGMGWFINVNDGNLWTPGSLNGHSTGAIYIPGGKMSIVVLCNKGEFNLAVKIGFQIAKAVSDLVKIN